MSECARASSAQSDVGDGRGILYPTRLPTFHREPAPAALEGLVRWFWIPRWRLAPGRTSRQQVLPFPASNLVVQPEGVTLAGPTTRASHRDLRGTGWAVGALLRPAGLASLHEEPESIRDVEVPFDAPDLHLAVATAMEQGADAVAVQEFTGLLTVRLGPPDETGLLANAMEDLVATDRTVVRVDQVAERLGVSVRSVQRLSRRHIGLGPLAVIRRYRLQEAAQRLREEPSLTIAQVAAGLGYADQAHLSADFRAALGRTPNDYRRDPAHPGR